MLGLQSAILMFMIPLVTIGIMVYAKDPKVVYVYVTASAITDFPHWTSFAYVLSWERLRQWKSWDGPLWAQLLVPVVTLLFKLGYLGGFFGKDKVLSDFEGGKGALGRKGL